MWDFNQISAAVPAQYFNLPQPSNVFPYQNYINKQLLEFTCFLYSLTLYVSYSSNHTNATARVSEPADRARVRDNWGKESEPTLSFGRWLQSKLTVSSRHVAMCGSRKYPYPTHGRDFSYDLPSPLVFQKRPTNYTPPSLRKFQFFPTPPGNISISCF